MFENIGDMAKMLSSMQKNAKKLEEELLSKTFNVKTGGGLVEIIGNGKGEVVDLMIDDSLLEDKEALQILLLGAINDLLKMVEQNKQNSAMGMLGGINPFSQQ